MCLYVGFTSPPNTIHCSNCGKMYMVNEADINPVTIVAATDDNPNCLNKSGRLLCRRVTIVSKRSDKRHVLCVYTHSIDTCIYLCWVIYLIWRELCTFVFT